MTIVVSALVAAVVTFLLNSVNTWIEHRRRRREAQRSRREDIYVRALTHARELPFIAGNRGSSQPFAEALIRLASLQTEVAIYGSKEADEKMSELVSACIRFRGKFEDDDDEPEDDDEPYDATQVLLEHMSCMDQFTRVVRKDLGVED